MESNKNRLNRKLCRVLFSLLVPAFVYFSLAQKASAQTESLLSEHPERQEHPIVDFYSTQTSSEDANMISMTTDLFFTQMQSISGYIVNDKRSIPYTPETASASNISFYAEIQESEDGGWICTLNACVKNKNSSNGTEASDNDKTVSETKVYNSFYKILMDAKTSLENILQNVSEASAAGSLTTSSGNAVTDILNSSSMPLISSLSSMDDLAGTWDGEANIDKIIIMRAGRGFIIFSNGASMNITISMEGNYISIKQTGRSNASFYPELPRQTALQIASTAEPVSWKLVLSDSKTLTGSKSTLIADSSSPDGVAPAFLNVTWTKRNN